MDTIVITKTSYKGILRNLARLLIIENIARKHTGPFNGHGLETTTQFKTAVKTLNKSIDNLPSPQVFQEKEEMTVLVVAFANYVLGSLDIPELLAYEEAFNNYINDMSSVEAKTVLEAFYEKHSIPEL